MKVAEVKEGMQFVLNDGMKVEYTGNGVFRDIKSGKKYLEDNVISKIRYGLKSNDQLTLNDGDEEALGLPTFNFGDENKEPVTANAGDETPLGTPDWN